MKASNQLLGLLTAILFFAGCQKEVVQDKIDTEAGGSLPKTISGDCMPVVMGGIYVQNTALTAANYMDVHVDFASTGDYEIKSDTINGYSFKGTGHVTTTGANIVRLAANGTPLAAGTDIFAIHFDTSICHTSVVVNTAAAQYTFGSTLGVCTGVTITGNYVVGAALGATHTAAVQVNVTSLGSYSISTNTVNGMVFSKSSSFTTLGLQTVILAGNGTPLTAGTSTFNTATTGGCNFDISVTNPAGSLATLTTSTISGVTCTAAVSGGTITNDGGSAISARGICYATTIDPTTANMVVNSGSGTGSFTSNITGLTAGTTYHVRAFATNSAGTAYGNDISFTTTTGCTINIFVAGWDDVFNISGNIRTPKIWINTTGSFAGTALPFTPNAGAVEANSVFVSGTDVYEAGTDNGTATLWKNGIATNLSPVPSSPFFYTGRAYSVYVAGSDVYVSGYSQANVATLWKNGVATYLNTGTFGAVGNAVFVSGTDVYVAGYENKMVGSNLVMQATIWKNGVATYLTTGSVDAVANSVFVAGSDVYVAGKEGNVAKVWKNGVGTPLSVTGSNAAVANAILVSGADVYVVGREDDGTSINSYAKIWKNGVGTLLTTSGYRNSANAVFVFNSEVFVAGAKSTGGANTMAAIWRNGFFTPLTAGSTDAAAFGVFVK